MCNAGLSVIDTVVPGGGGVGVTVVQGEEKTGPQCHAHTVQGVEILHVLLTLSCVITSFLCGDISPPSTACSARLRSWKLIIFHVIQGTSCAIGSISFYTHGKNPSQLHSLLK